jgi:6-phosphogluconolactonase
VTSPEVRIESDAAALAHRAAQAFWELVDATLTTRPTFRVALAGGHTPTGLYHELVRQRPSSPAWQRLQFFFGDERAVPPDHIDSNYRMARTALFDHAPVVPSQVHRMPGEQRPLDAAAAAYEAVVNREALDLVLLGIGNDGHTCSLFPGDPVLQESERWVRPVLAPPGNAVRERLTLTLPAIAAARQAWFLVNGAAKARVVERVLRTPADPPLPAALVAAPQVVWYLDRMAGSGLELS